MKLCFNMPCVGDDRCGNISLGMLTDIYFSDPMAMISMNFSCNLPIAANRCQVV